MEEPTKETFPMRINKYLAHKGIATRRDADELVARGRIHINGRTALIGEKVSATDEVTVAPTRSKKTYRYVAFHKPRGIVTHSPQGRETDILALLAGGSEKLDLFPVGRLDKDSHGLIILTNDGRITDRLLNPERDHEKEYLVKTKKPLRESFKAAMERGVDIGDYVTKPCTVVIKNENTFTVTLGEGKKHQIRRMVDALHNEVADLKRIRIMRVPLGMLAPGAFRELTGSERTTFLQDLGLTA